LVGNELDLLPRRSPSASLEKVCFSSEPCYIELVTKFAEVEKGSLMDVVDRVFQQFFEGK
jgi:hypothetical protein